MTWNELEKKLKYYLYEDRNYRVLGKFRHGYKIIGLNSLIYLCKKCYEQGSLDILQRQMDKESI